MMTALLMTLLAGLPEVKIADEHRPGGDLAEVKVTVTNRTEEPIAVSFKPNYWHREWFRFHLFDERGRPVYLRRTEEPDVHRGNKGLVRIEPGEAASGYLSPRLDYELPSGRYRVMVSYLHQVPHRGIERECRSNRITKTFP